MKLRINNFFINILIISFSNFFLPRISPSAEQLTLPKIEQKQPNQLYLLQVQRIIKLEPDEFREPQVKPIPNPSLINNQSTTPALTNRTNISQKFIVSEFKLKGNRELVKLIEKELSKKKELSEKLEKFTNREITFVEVLQVEQIINDFYGEKGYVNSGAIIEANQTIEPKKAIITITIVEGSLKEIEISGLNRLNTNYVKSRLEIATEKPLNINKLLEALQLLQLNPLIENISAELSPTVNPTESILIVEAKEAKSFYFTPIFNNGRNPNVGSVRRGARIQENNLFGWGDGIDISYANTDGSDAFNGSYVIPVNAHNGKVRIAGGFSNTKIIQPPFDVLNITGNSEYYEIGYSQPIIEHPEQELTLGLTLSIQKSESFLDGEPFPLSLGADVNGNTDVTALRFYQDWIIRSPDEFFALRSQFSFGIEAFGATINEKLPDSRFFTWRNQAQYVRQLAPNTLFITRSDLQLSDNNLVSLEQFYLGGLNSVRGYPQDLQLTDNGFLLSTEIWYPIWENAPNFFDNKTKGVVQIIPFIDFGIGWNAGEIPNPNPNTLVGTGLGLQWQMGDNFSARIDWGIPLVDVDVEKRDLNSNGIYFNINVNASF